MFRSSWTAFALVLLGLAASPAHGGGGENETSFEAGRDAVARARAQISTAGTAKNAILFLGDGMGVSTVTAARILEGQLRGEAGEENRLSFESFPHVALIKTYNTDQQTPDSAGSMTAIVTGSKTRAGVLSVGPELQRGDFARVGENELRTILEQAEERGLSTGVVTTTTVSHATPAALYAHVPDRNWQDDSDLPPEARAANFPDIARQLIEFDYGDGPEVVLGGGRQHFRPRELHDPEFPAHSGRREDGRDLTAEWVAGGENAAFIWNRRQLLGLNPENVDHLLGLFALSHMDFECDRNPDATGDPSLSEMTAAALSILQRNSSGYFLMVEGGRIDHAHHAGNAYRALTDTIELSNAVRTAVERTDPDDTLIIVTADHSHVFTIAGYPKRGNDILGKVVGNASRGAPGGELSLDALGRPYTTLGYQNGPGYFTETLQRDKTPVHHPTGNPENRGATKGRPELIDVDTSNPDFLQDAATPLASETHGGEDVAIYATGPGSDLFHGTQEQHYIYHAMVESLGWNRRGFLQRLFD